MGVQPAYIFIARHGARLDAADKQWHLTSPTPYDTPLTYAGWQNAKSLGATIGTILRNCIAQDEAAAATAAASENPTVSPRKPKRYRIVIHSSPFLRCIQTSIGIGAGLAQEPAITNVTSTPSRLAPRCVLRLDAFLGEWLTPSYYQTITPPASSVMMLASAKAELLRRENYHEYLVPESNNANSSLNNSSTTDSQPNQLWNYKARNASASISFPINPSSSPTPANLASMSNIFRSLPSAATSRSPAVASTPTSKQPHPSRTFYRPPVLNYAISSNSPIPKGLVAHARDSTMQIDYQWDSMRPPINWGDGGTLGEEWAAMHQRFRTGLQHLFDWYSTADDPSAMVTKMKARPSAPHTSASAPAGDDNNDDDFETESVVILVSHGAGCNALIGAITDQPVLTEVAMTSLTMASRKPVDAMQSWSHPPSSTPVHAAYDLEILASTDHLQSHSSSPTNPAQSPHPTSTHDPARAPFAPTSTTLPSSRIQLPSIDTQPRRRRELGSFSFTRTPDSYYSPGGRGMADRPSSSGITVGSGITSFLPTNRPSRSRAGSNAPSLWSPLSQRTQADDSDSDDDADDMLLAFDTYDKPAHTVPTPPCNEKPAPGLSATMPPVPPMLLSTNLARVTEQTLVESLNTAVSYRSAEMVPPLSTSPSSLGSDEDDGDDDLGLSLPIFDGAMESHLTVVDCKGKLDLAGHPLQTKRRWTVTTDLD